MSSITISIVSHNQGQMVSQLLDQLAGYATNIAKVVVTHNTKSNDKTIKNNYPFEMINLQNQEPLGFATNHNQAFQFCETSYFCVINPDISITNEPFDALLTCLEDLTVSVVAPIVIGINGKREDNARYFPTPIGLVRKMFSRYDGSFPIDNHDSIIFPDWIGGMFMLFSTQRFKELAGFDEKFYLYYEDVDLCLRSWQDGYKVLLCKNVSVVHDARRTSHKNWQYLKWHLASALRFFVKHIGRFPNKVI